MVSYCYLDYPSLITLIYQARGNRLLYLGMGDSVRYPIVWNGNIFPGMVPAILESSYYIYTTAKTVRYLILREVTGTNSLETPN